ncbi:MAG: hypothetical protein GX125_07705 [Bacteroidales bacterium]|jgi:hypothetical protein|nr:hypothetical protein [Bacteroidales bacterium]
MNIKVYYCEDVGGKRRRNPDQYLSGVFSISSGVNAPDELSAIVRELCKSAEAFSIVVS